MQTFKYTARDKSTNKIVKSTITAQSESEAAKILMAQKIVPTKLEAAGSGSGGLEALRSRVSAKDRVIFTRQLATMINAGLPLAQSLNTVQDQTANKALKNIIGEVAGDVNGGTALSDSFAKHPKVFNNVYIALVEAGEASGTLDKSLERLAAQQEHDADMLSKIRGAMMYPAIVLAVIVGVVGFMLVMLVPQVESLYADMNRMLPLQTRILVAIANFFINRWYIVLLVMIGVVFLLRRWIQTESGRRAWDSFKLNMPLFSPLFRKLYMARFSRTSEVLLSSGVPMLESLKISADATNNVVVRDAILRSANKVKNGKPLSEGLEAEENILPFVPQMVKIGETAGGVDTMLGKVADYYEKEVDNAIKSISTLIEPILMVIMAGLIGFIVLAVLLPIYALSDSV